MLLKKDYAAVYGVKESIAATSHLNMYLYIYLICGRGKQFSKLNQLVKQLHELPA